MELGEYRLRMKVHELKRLDALRDEIQLGLMRRTLKATKKDKYVITEESQLLDFKKVEREIMFGDLETAETYRRLEKIAQNLKEYRKLKEGEKNA